MNLNTIYPGDCLEVLKTLPSNSVNCVVTSPPYWALRDYGVEGQLGLEPTFQEYVTKLCDIFDEVKRVLKDDGTCWVNLGDTYAGGNGNTSDYERGSNSCIPVSTRLTAPKGKPMSAKVEGVKNKSLCQIPSRFAIEMTNRGWILRNTIIWHKPNCMPSSVQDRFTVDFEKVFFFVKNKKYWFEQQYEPSVDPESYTGRRQRNAPQIYYSDKSNCQVSGKVGADGKLLDSGRTYPFRNKRTVWQVTTKPFREAHFATYPEALIEPMIKAGCPEGGTVLDPFFGAGTTGLVALKQNKSYIGIELNPEYISIAEKRLHPYLTQTKLAL